MMCTARTHPYSTATSTDAERVFSRGGLTVSRLRHSLSDASVRASALLGSWSTLPDLIPEKETIALLKAHIRKTRVGGGGGGDNDNDNGPPGGLASAVKAEPSRSAPRAFSSHPSTRPSTPSTRPSTPANTSSSQAHASTKAKKTGSVPPGLSRSSSAASLTSDTRSTRALLAASGSKKTKARVPAGSGKARAADPDVVVISDSE